MQTDRPTSEINLQDVPWTAWVIAGCLTIVIAVVAARLWLQWDDTPYRELSPQIGLALVLLIGFFVFATKPALSCKVDSQQRMITVSSGGLLNTDSTELQFHEIATCYVEHWRQSDTTPVYRIGLRLRSGESLPITNWSRDQQHTNNLCLKIRRAIGSA